VTAASTSADGARWSGADTLILIAVTCLAGVLRFAGIRQPGGFIFDEFYAADACLYVLGPQASCLTPTEISFVHPPLAKWLIGAGIRLFGFGPAGWRVAPLVAGTLSIALMYLLAHRLLRSTLAASVASSLLTFDLLHFVMSRTAMLDIFVVFFGLASFLCLVYDADRRESTPSPSSSLARRLGERPWLLGAGIMGGAALACKWSGGYLLAAVALLSISRHARRTNDSRNWLRRAMDESAVLFVALAVVPMAVYIASYAGRLNGALLAWPWSEESWLRAFLARQQAMLGHHTGALYVHPYTSSAWSWLLVKRPVLFYFRDAGTVGYREILALGNPFIWWAALVALVVTAWRAARRRSIAGAERIIIAGFIAGYVPWLVITRQEAFLYYLLPAVPFLYLALARVVTNVSSARIRAAAIASLAIASIGAFSFFRPVLVGATLTHAQWERRMLFSNCGPALSGTHKKPVDRVIPPPSGWCWV
jgi:dolichyl-phosphate-mannose--protein O-mannosyl transferase